jgi:hypothetical protein
MSTVRRATAPDSLRDAHKPDSTTGQQRRKLPGTSQQQLVFLNTHWGRTYTFAAPEEPGGQWTATANFGQHDQIHGWSAAELLEEVRGHYQANRPARR